MRYTYDYRIRETPAPKSYLLRNSIECVRIIHAIDPYKHNNFKSSAFESAGCIIPNKIKKDTNNFDEFSNLLQG